MNKIKYLIAGRLAALICNSCDSLDLSPEDFYGSGNFWNNSAQVEGYMIGLHNNLRGSYNMFFQLGETRGGAHRTGVSSISTGLNNSSPQKTNEFTYSSTGISNWFGLYSNIMQVNHFIQNVEEGCDFLSASDRGFYLGQAYGLRALYYTYLYKTYGGVPLITTVNILEGQISAENLYTERSTASATLSFIKEDIRKSEDNFAANLTHDPAMWSKYATLMLKADVYLWSAKVSTADYNANASDIQTARESLSQVLGKFSLLQNFSNTFSQKGNDEIIFAIRFADKEATNYGHYFVYSQAPFVGQMYGRDGKLINTDTLNLKATGLLRHEYKFGLFKSFDDTDLRRDAIFMEYTGRNDQGEILDYGLSMKKYIGSINSENNRIYDSDVIVWRYAEVLLMMAEIENKLGNNAGVKQYMDEVRSRAYGSNFNESAAFTPGSYGENELAILRERDKEFVGEGKRWFDVVRMQDDSGKSLVFATAANYKHMDSDFDQPVLAESKAYMILWPIDVTTLNNDPKLENNPGYQ
jgi:hypothetical protein